MYMYMYIQSFRPLLLLKKQQKRRKSRLSCLIYRRTEHGSPRTNSGLRSINIQPCKEQLLVLKLIHTVNVATVSIPRKHAGLVHRPQEH